ncbi:hypothetical protein DFH11DRAFT_1745915 [Phellopilus nigrolimitatus]|nr:hypothetical protein DFH11DRAFT_1745915 [Phellopilus nigrolimitatus]
MSSRSKGTKRQASTETLRASVQEKKAHYLAERESRDTTKTFGAGIARSSSPVSSRSKSSSRTHQTHAAVSTSANVGGKRHSPTEAIVRGRQPTMSLSKVSVHGTSVERERAPLKTSEMENKSEGLECSSDTTTKTTPSVLQDSLKQINVPFIDPDSEPDSGSDSDSPPPTSPPSSADSSTETIRIKGGEWKPFSLSQSSFALPPLTTREAASAGARPASSDSGVEANLVGRADPVLPASQPLKNFFKSAYARRLAIAPRKLNLLEALSPEPQHKLSDVDLKIFPLEKHATFWDTKDGVALSDPIGQTLPLHAQLTFRSWTEDNIRGRECSANPEFVKKFEGPVGPAKGASKMIEISGGATTYTSGWRKDQNAWSKWFSVQIPVEIFAHRETRSFRAAAAITFKKMIGEEETLNAETDVTISHLYSAREMGRELGRIVDGSKSKPDRSRAFQRIHGSVRKLHILN